MKKKTLAGKFNPLRRTELSKVSGGGRSTARPYCEIIECNNVDARCPRLCVCNGDTCFG